VLSYRFSDFLKGQISADGLWGLGVQFLAQDKPKKKLLKRQPPANETA
jgi:hypothetical protein